MKIRSIKPETFRLFIENPDGSGQDGTYLDLISTDSSAFKESTFANAQRLRNKLSTRSNKELTPKESHYESRLTAASLVIGWGPDEEWGGPFNKDELVQLLLENTWLFQQVENAAGERRNFFRRDESSNVGNGQQADQAESVS